MKQYKIKKIMHVGSEIQIKMAVYVTWSREIIF